MENQVIETQNNSVATLFDKVKIVDSVVNQATAMNIEAANLKIEAEKKRKAAQTAKKTRIWAPLLALFPGILVISILAPIAAIILGIILWLPKNGPKPLLEKAEECEKQSKEKTESANMLVQQHINELSIIPQKYWYPLATNFIVEVIQTGRATTIPIALDKLEEQIHRWNMEQSMHQQIALQMAQTEALRKIEVNTAVSAVANVADLFF